MPKDTTQLCPTCQRPIGIHTVDELSEHLATVHDHEMPFEAMPETTQDLQMLPAGSVAVRAAVQRTSIGTFPVLVFDFAGPAGVIPSIALLLDEQHMRSVRTLVGAAIDAALKAARRAR